MLAPHPDDAAPSEANALTPEEHILTPHRKRGLFLFHQRGWDCSCGAYLPQPKHIVIHAWSIGYVAGERYGDPYE